MDIKVKWFFLYHLLIIQSFKSQDAIKNNKKPLCLSLLLILYSYKSRRCIHSHGRYYRYICQKKWTPTPNRSNGSANDYEILIEKSIATECIRPNVNDAIWVKGYFFR